MTMKLNCSILTPERTLYEGQVEFAIVQAHDGEIGFLYNHAPLVSELGVGEVRLRTANTTDFFYVEGGFVEIKENDLILICEQAMRKDELVRSEIEYKINDFTKLDVKERMKLDIELRKLKARLKVAAR
ncbi:MAG TPA: ATP synthase F1 subunit epsilon [Spirochaetota bacterium]|nr:ATP synthase F1 subunit epsilon [Spirochaetota bacterium]HNT11359.1 ATP synthase F1 subunit epsilon [Spirochaetota bacterium]HNV47170.1 ATP synthase F1 subunit epsilon [Spirochaetota bacterium]HOS38734.1 ATP synthase F1 subunit epsilon [Spirochaetota bacterium]HPI21779.1 ATP synthase F1 subunit epsilon [Spirochaetota bacterium]